MLKSNQSSKLIGVGLWLCMFLFVACNDPENQEDFELNKDSFETEEITLTNLDSINRMLRKAIEANDYNSAFDYQFRKYELVDQDSAQQTKAILDTLSLLANKSEVLSNRALSDYKLGRYYRINNQPDSAYHYYNQAKNKYLILGDSLQIAKSLMAMGKTQYSRMDYYGCEQSTIEGLEYLNSDDSDVYFISAFNVLGYSSLKQNNFEVAISWFNKGISVNPESKYTYALKSNIALCEQKRGNYQKALDGFLALQDHEQVKADVAKELRLLDNIAETYFYLGNYEKAEGYTRRSIEMSQSQNINNLTDSYFLLAQINDKVHQGRSVIPLAKRALESTSNSEKRLEILMFLGSKPIANRAAYLEEYIGISDSLDIAQQSSANRFAAIRFENTKNEETILRLRADKAKQELALAKQQNRSFIYSITIIFVIISAIFLLFFFRSHFLKKRKLAIYQTESEISKRVHDEVANDVYQLLNTVENSKISQPELLDRLESVYLRSRKISREISSERLTTNFTDNLTKLLQSYQNSEVRIFTRNLTTDIWKNTNDDLKVNIYRILQELMTNMKKHSEADLVIVSFERSNKMLKVMYRDNGKGTDVDSLAQNGFQNVANRIKISKGSFKFDTDNGSGLSLTIEIPL